MKIKTFFSTVFLCLYLFEQLQKNRFNGGFVVVKHTDNGNTTNISFTLSFSSKLATKLLNWGGLQPEASVAAIFMISAE